VALYSSGILGPITGCIGPYKVRRRANGSLLFLPRYVYRPPTPLQLIWRRHFAEIARMAGKCYLSIGRPYYRGNRPFFNGFTRSLQLSISTYEPEGYPKEVCCAAGDLPVFHFWFVGDYVGRYPVKITWDPSRTPWALPTDTVVFSVQFYRPQKLFVSPPTLRFSAREWTVFPLRWYPERLAIVNAYIIRDPGLLSQRISARYGRISWMPLVS